MTAYQLVKLVSMVGTLETRKRLQKVVYLLQESGMDFDASFRLHHYGPYSSDVADLLNQMSDEGILVQNIVPNQAGSQYNYIVADEWAAKLDEFENSNAGQLEKIFFDNNADLIHKLLKGDLRQMELGSTIAYFRRQKNESWENAFTHACQFKSVSPEAAAPKAALDFAKDIIGSSEPCDDRQDNS